MKYIIPLILVLANINCLFAQEVYSTFSSTRILNNHSNETIEKNTLDFRVAHRFGNLSDGTTTFFGLEEAADVRIGFEYGVSDDIMIGVARVKGVGIVSQLWEGFFKWKFLAQNETTPMTLTLFTNMVISSKQASTDSTSALYFTEFTDRISYTTQLIATRKFNDRLSLALMPTYVHRNFVVFEDENGVFSMGAAARYRFSKSLALLVEYFYTVSDLRNNTESDQYFNPLCLGLEVKTGGHVFILNVNNTEGILPNEFVPYTSYDWLNGDFRLGFSISRIFRF